MRAPQAVTLPQLDGDRFTLECDALPHGARLVRMAGHEALGEPYVFTLDVVLPGDAGQAFQMETAVGARATLHLHDPQGEPVARYQGMLAAVDWVDGADGHALYRVQLVPRLWALGLSQHSNVYVDKDIRAIVADVLKAGGLAAKDWALQLDPASTYLPMPHVSQYRESDLAFLQRRLERDGLYYFFEQEEGGEKLVITDTASAHPLSGSVRYLPACGLDTTETEVFRTVSCRHAARPKLVRLREFDYERPTANLKREEAVAERGQGEVVSHDENYSKPEEGRRLARVRAQELAARAVVLEAQGPALKVRAGARFRLTDHPRFDGEWLAVRVEHEGQQGPALAQGGPAYTVRVEAIPATTQYRPARVTPVPRVYGTEMGVVDGAQDSEYAQIDAQGRYKLHLFFDEVDGRSGKASTWVRMLQPHGGSQEGFHFPLRKGTEVMVVFLGGDPDRPVIAGVVPNGHTPSPVTEANLTQNVLLTASGNLMRMEDQRGQEHVTLSTPNLGSALHLGHQDPTGYNLHLTTQGQGRVHTQGKLDVVVCATKTETVTEDVTETYSANQTTHVKGNRKLTVDNTDDTHVKTQLVLTDADRTVTVKGAQKHVLETTDTTKVTGMQTLDADGGQTVTVGSAGRTETVHGKLEQTVDGDVTLTHKSNFTQTVTGKSDTRVIGDVATTVMGMDVVVKQQNSSETIVGMKNENVVGAKLESVIGGHVTLDVGGVMETTLAAKLAVHVGPRLEKSFLTLEKEEAKIQQTTINIVNNVSVRIVKTSLQLNQVVLMAVL